MKINSWNHSTLNVAPDGVTNQYLSNDHMAVLLCDARDNGQLTANFVVLGEWPEDFEPFAGRIVIIRSGAKKTRKRQRTEQKIMWKSPRGWKVLKNVHCEDVMVQYRARSDEQYRYRMFCFRASETTRDESLAILHVTYTPEHPKGAHPRAMTNSVSMRFPGEATSLADDAAFFHDAPYMPMKHAPATLVDQPYGGFGGFGEYFPPASPASSASDMIGDATEEDLERPRKRQKREGSPASDVSAPSTDLDVAPEFSSELPAGFFCVPTIDVGLPADLFAAYPAYTAERDQFLPQFMAPTPVAADFDVSAFMAADMDF